MRDWIEDELITPQGLRNQMLKEDALQSQRVDAKAISLLRREASDTRGAAPGDQLAGDAHDRLVQPIRSEQCRVARGASDILPAPGRSLGQGKVDPAILNYGAQRSRQQHVWAASDADELTSAERDFLKISVQSQATREAAGHVTTWRFVSLVVMRLRSDSLRQLVYSSWLRCAALGISDKSLKWRICTN